MELDLDANVVDLVLFLERLGATLDPFDELIESSAVALHIEDLLLHRTAEPA